MDSARSRTTDVFMASSKSFGAIPDECPRPREWAFIFTLLVSLCRVVIVSSSPSLLLRGTSMPHALRGVAIKCFASWAASEPHRHNFEVPAFLAFEFRPWIRRQLEALVQRGVPEGHKDLGETQKEALRVGKQSIR